MTKFVYHEDGTTSRSSIFVFGSNLAGIHGAGAAKEAYQTFGARYGVEGHEYQSGFSESYNVRVVDSEIVE